MRRRSPHDHLAVSRQPRQEPPEVQVHRSIPVVAIQNSFIGAFRKILPEIPRKTSLEAFGHGPVIVAPWGFTRLREAGFDSVQAPQDQSLIVGAVRSIGAVLPQGVLLENRKAPGFLSISGI